MRILPCILFPLAILSFVAGMALTALADVLTTLGEHLMGLATWAARIQR